MNREFAAEKLDTQITEFLAGSSQDDATGLLEIATELQRLPRQAFRDRLRNDLLTKADALGRDAQASAFSLHNTDLMPSLESRDFSFFPADPRSFIFSFLSHAAAVVLIASGIWVTERTIPKKSTPPSELTYIPMPLGQDAPRGGGSGGDHSTVEVSRGTPPKFSETQLAPPAIVVHNPIPRLPVEPTVLGPPQIKLPQSNRIGDLLSSNATMPSNGTGRSGGMGNNTGTGLGSGDGAGFGAGSEAGFGGEAFHPGNRISAPRAIYDPEPEYSDEARRIRYQGVVVLSLIVDPTGRARNIHVVRPLGLGLDEKAIEAVQKWKFEPGMKNGRPVAVQVNVEVNFRLY